MTTAISRTNRHGRGVTKTYVSPALLKKTATTTTSRVDRYKTKTKGKFINFKLLGTSNDTTNIEDRDKLWNKGSKGLATTTQLYTAK